MITRRLILACGLSATGKSRWCETILASPIGAGARFFDIDRVREATWGSRAKQIKATEHRFKNEITRFEVKKAFVLGASTVVLNMVMPTKQNHQAPFMEMVRDTERILTEIERYYGHDEAIKIEVRALWFDCDEATARRRLEERSKAAHESDLTDIGVWLHNKSWFEPPDGTNYPYLWIDTSVETEEADQQRLAAIMEFLQ